MDEQLTSKPTAASGSQLALVQNPSTSQRATPSISSILGSTPAAHTRLPPLPHVQRGLEDGESHEPDPENRTASLSTSGPTCLPSQQPSDVDHQRSFVALSLQHKGHPQSAEDLWTQKQQQIQQQDEELQQQSDHLLLRQPAPWQPSFHDTLPNVPAAAAPVSCLTHANSNKQHAEQQQLDSRLSFPRRLSRSPKCTKDDIAGIGEAPPNKPNSWKAWRLKLLGFLDAPCTTWLLMLMTLFVIFQEDFKYAVMPPSADLGFEATTLAFLLLFLVEIGLSCLVRPHFFLSFYFWLDTIATVSLAFELPALRAVLLLGATQEYIDLSAADSYLVAAGAQALVSSKAGRAAKLVRLFRQLQLIKLFRQLEVRQRLKRALAADDTSAAAPDTEAMKKQDLAVVEAQVMAKYNKSESRVGQRLSDLTMMRVITGILAMLIVLPALEITSGINGTQTPLALGGLHMLHSQAVTAGTNTTAFSSSLEAFKNTIQYELAGRKTGSLLYLVIANVTYVNSRESTQVSFHPNSTAGYGPATARGSRYRRYLEMQAATFCSWVCPAAAVGQLGSPREATSAEVLGPGQILLDESQSVYGIARTMFLACLLAVGAMLIHQDTFRLVLQPVQRMVERVREMAEDPLMQAAVKLNLAPAPAFTSNCGSSEAAETPGKEGAGGGDKSDKTGASKDLHHMGASLFGPQASTRLSRIRFGPSIRVHAFAGECDFDHAATPRSQSSTQQPPKVNSRTSLAVVAEVAARRLSAGVAAASNVAAKLRNQLAERTSAIKHLVTSESEDEAAQGHYETRLLEQSIYKICALLAVGFGDAGAEIIAENIKKEGDLNPIVPGKKTVAVFGFCDIRRFTDTTEVLQEGVMEFVNTIAHLVHGAVSARGGAANKNIGDAFLLVWKLPKGLDDRDVSLVSNSGASAGNAYPSSAAAAAASRLRATTLSWSGANGDSSSDEEDNVKGSRHPSGAGMSSRPGSAACTPKAGVSACGGGGTPARLSGLGGNIGGNFTEYSTSGAEELSKQLSSALQKDLTIKRATSGVMDLMTGRGKQHSSMSPVAGSSMAGDAASGGSVTSGSNSMSGIKRAVLGLKSVKTMPLSTAAKATIINTITDNALASFVIIQVAIAVSRLLNKYSKRADLNARMPGFQVQMGFGLHVGWAIEGAIGSEYKIDASYLSPNVNLASRLEAATKQYSVPLLLSRDFVDCLSPGVRAKVRQIDYVTVKGSNQPLGLFCYDLDLEAAKSTLRALAETHRAAKQAALGEDDLYQLSGATTTSKVPSGSAHGPSVVSQPLRNSLAALPGAAGAARSSVVMTVGHITRGEDEFGVEMDEAELLLALDHEDDWVDNPVIASSWGISWSFKEDFEQAFQCYLSGDWVAAKRGLESCLLARINASGQQVMDGPSKTLLDVMAVYGYKAPAGWKGVRELTEK